MADLQDIQGSIADTIKNDVLDTRVQDMRVSLRNAYGMNPDQAARASALADQAGVPFDTAYRNKDELEKRAALESVDYRDLAENTPHTAAFFSDPAKAAFAHDDLDAIRNVEVKLKPRILDYPRAFLGTAIQAEGQAAQGVAGYAKDVSRSIGADFMQKHPALSTQTGAARIFSGLLGTAAKGVGDTLVGAGEAITPPDTRRSTGTDVAGGLGQVVSQMIPFLINPAIGEAHMAATSLGQGAQQQQDRLDKAGVTDPLLRLGAQTLGAAATYGTERVELGVLMKGVPNLYNLVGKMPSVLQSRWVTAPINVAGAGAVEAAQETLEQLAHDTIEYLAYNPDVEFLKGAREQAETAGAVGALARTVVMGVSHAKKRTVMQDHQKAADTAADSLKEQVEAVSSSKTAARAPKEFKDFVRQTSGGENVYLSPDAAKLFQEMPDAERNALYETVDGLREKVETAAATGADITMKKADFLTMPNASAFTEHAKAYPDGYSRAQLADPETVKRIERQIEEMGQKVEADDHKAVRRQIEQEWQDKIKQSGAPYSAKEAAQVAALSDFYLTNAATPELALEYSRKAMVANEDRKIKSGLGEAERMIAEAKKQSRDILTEAKSYLAAAQKKAEKGGAWDSYSQKMAEWNKAKAAGQKLPKPKKPRSAPRNLPVMKMLGSFGGVNPAGGFAAELARMDITPKTEPWLFKKGGRDSFDNIPAAEAIAALGAHIPTETDQNGYVDPQWLLDQIQNELAGRPIIQPEAGSDSMMDDFIAEMDRLGVDVATATQADMDAALREQASSIKTHALDITPSMRESAQRGLELFQGNKGSYRGYLAPLVAGRYLLAVGKKANKSTVLHEMGHLFMHQMQDMANAGHLKAERAKMWEDTKAYFNEHRAEVAREGNRIAKDRGSKVVVTEADVIAAMKGDMRLGKTFQENDMDALIAQARQFVTDEGGNYTDAEIEEIAKLMARGYSVDHAAEAVAIEWSIQNDPDAGIGESIPFETSDTGGTGDGHIQDGNVPDAADGGQTGDGGAPPQQPENLAAQEYALTAIHELFARKFEAYVREGKAPSTRLRRAFQAFKLWMLKIYQANSDLKTTLDPEIVALFDRMLASDRDIELVRGAAEFRPLTREMFTGTDDEYAAYMTMHQDAVDYAKDDVLTQYLDRYDQEQSEEWRNELIAVKEDVRGELKKDKLYGAIFDLTNGTVKGSDGQKIKLSKTALEKDFPQIIKDLSRDRLRGKEYIYTPKGGFSPDVLAAMYEFDSGEEFVRAVAAAKPFEDAVSERALAKMTEKYGDGTVDDKAARAAMQNDKRALILAADLKALGVKVGAEQAEMRQAEADQAADNIISRRKVGDISSATFLNAERVSGNSAYNAALDGKFEQALDHKRKQIANYYLYRAAKRAEAEQERFFKRTKNLSRKKNEDLKGIDGDYADLVKLVMRRAGMAARSVQYPDFDTLLDRVAESNDVDSAVIAQELAPLRNTLDRSKDSYDELTHDEFTQVADLVDMIAHLGREQKGYMVEGRKFERAAAVEQINDTFRKAMKVGQDGVKRVHDMKFIGKVLDYHASNKRMESVIVSFIGKDNQDHPLWTQVFHPVKEGAEGYREERQAVNTALAEIYRPIKDRINSRKIDAPEFGGYVFENRGEVIEFLRHFGNESNADKMLRGLAIKVKQKKGLPDSADLSFTMENFHAFLNRMADEGMIIESDMDHVVAMWKLIGGFKERLQQTHKTLKGYRFDEVQAKPLQTPWGEKEGGYFPIKYDPIHDVSVAQRQSLEDMMANKGLSEVASVYSNFTKGRDQRAAKPIDTDPLHAISHVESVLKYVHLGVPIARAHRILSDKTLQHTMLSFDNHLYSGVFKPWLENAANQRTSIKGMNRLTDSFWSTVRNRGALKSQFLNIVNTLQQAAGIFPAIQAVGAENMKNAAVAVARDREGMHKAALAASSTLRQATLMLDERVSKSDVVNFATGRTISGNNTAMQNVLAATAEADAFGAKYGYIMQSLFQNEINIVTWIAAYSKYVGQHGIDGDAQGFTDKEAIRYANTVVRQTQTSQHAEDVAAGAVSTPFVKIFSMFSGWYNGMGNARNAEIMYLIRTQGLAAAKGQIISAMFYYSLPYLLGQMLFDWFKDDLPEDDNGNGTSLDEWLGYVPVVMATSVMNEFLFMGALSHIAYNELLDKPKFGNTQVIGSAALGALDQAMGLGEDVGNLLSGASVDASRFVQNGLAAIQMLTGVTASGQFGRSAGYVANVAEGDVQPENTSEFVKGLVAGTPAK